MTDSLDNGTERISCSDIALFFDKEVSESLGDEKRQEVSIHLSGCPRCREFVTLVSSLPLFPGALSEDEIASGVQKVLENARRERNSERARMPRWAAVAVAASLAALTIVGVLRLVPFGSEPAQSPGGFQCAPGAPDEPVDGVFMTYCEGVKQPETIIENSGDLKVSLRTGTIGVLVDPDRPDKKNVEVETPHGTVRVKGTVFTVRVEDETTWVEVFRGVVEIVSNTGDATPVKVAAGHGVDMVDGKPFVLTTPATDVLRRRLAASALGQGRNGSSGAAEILSTNEIAAPKEPDETFDSEGEQGGDESVAVEAHRGPDGAQRPALETMYDLIQEAQACLIDRDWACAAARYRTVLERYSRRPESLAVLISLAKVELRYLGAPKDALAHYKNYQRRAPNGPLAEEALFGIAEAYQRLGRTDAENQTLHRFVEQFPTSSLVEKARTRLRQLEE